MNLPQTQLLRSGGIIHEMALVLQKSLFGQIIDVGPLETIIMVVIALEIVRQYSLELDWF